VVVVLKIDDTVVFSTDVYCRFCCMWLTLLTTSVLFGCSSVDDSGSRHCLLSLSSVSRLFWTEEHSD